MPRPLKRPTSRLARSAVSLAWFGLCGLASAAGLQPMTEEAMSKEVGRDGINFALDLHVDVGSQVIGVYDPKDAPAFFRRNNFLTTGTFLASLDIRPGEAGNPDYIDWVYPNISTTKPLQSGYDLVIEASGQSFGTGVTYQDISLAGGSMQWSTGATGGLAFGKAINTTIGHVLLGANVRSSKDGQMMDISGVKVSGAVDGTPWVLANLTTQPGTFRALGDGKGGTNLQFGIDWPKGNAEAGIGKMSIDNVSFQNISSSATTTQSIGGVSIGSMQIQYLNIKIK